MEVRRFDVNGGHRVERITRTDSHQFPRERRGPPQRLHTPIIIISSSVTHINGPTFIRKLTQGSLSPLSISLILLLLFLFFSISPFSSIFNIHQQHIAVPIRGCRAIFICEALRPQSIGNLISSMLYQVIFAYLIPVLTGILGANTQGRTEPLFKTHAINMWCFIVAKAIYCFALAADIKSRLHRENSLQLSGLVAIVSGSVSAVSLITTFLPPSIGHIILYTSWFCAATVIVLYQYGIFLMDACRRFYYDTLKLLFTRIWNWFQVN